MSDLPSELKSDIAALGMTVEDYAELIRGTLQDIKEQLARCTVLDPEWNPDDVVEPLAGRDWLDYVIGIVG